MISGSNINISLSRLKSVVEEIKSRPRPIRGPGGFVIMHFNWFPIRVWMNYQISNL